ncbi:ABC transporter permease [Stella sp.]|uniref:ABC transporter permease n=1 Tax=Stella sp. TaxID=2912054 RepID=UPI0035B37148
MRRLLTLFNLLMVAYVVAPIVLVVWMSFTPTMLFEVPVRRFSLRWYEELFSYDAFVDSAWLSLHLGLVAALVATALGFLAAYGLVRGRPPGSSALLGLFTAPLIVPAVVYGIAMLQFTNLIGLYGSVAALAAAHVVIVLPFAVRTLLAALEGQGPELEWAAMSLGARRRHAVLLVTLPLCLRGMVSAFLFCFLISFSEVTVTLFMAGPAHQTLPVRIFNYVSDRIDPTMAAVSALVVLVSVVLVLMLNRLGALGTARK